MSALPTIFTYELDDAQQKSLLSILESGAFKPREVPYSLRAVSGDGYNVTLYEKEKHGKRKCCIQGSKAHEFVAFYLEPQVTGVATLGYEEVLNPDRDKPHAGSDESGKGDYFGPLVVACCYVDEVLAKVLRDAGVKDCKQMTDARVLAVGAKIRQLLGPMRYAVLKLSPSAYNRLYARMQNLNRMLAWAHGACLEELLEKQPTCPRAVIDQFAPTEATIQHALKTRGKGIVVEQHHKAESDIAVAAASVVAREIFLRDLTEDMKGASCGVAGVEPFIPKGSSDPRVRELAEKCVRQYGAAWLVEHCKCHFQTTDKVLAACGMTRAALSVEQR